MPSFTNQYAEGGPRFGQRPPQCILGELIEFDDTNKIFTSPSDSNAPGLTFTGRLAEE